MGVFKASLALKPDYAEARLWWDKTTTRVALIRNAVDGYDEDEGVDLDGEQDGDGGGAVHGGSAGLARRAGAGAGGGDETA